MSKTVIGVFSSRDQAEGAVHSLRQKGFEKEISIMAKDDSKPRSDRNSETYGTDSITNGATTGGVIGGVAGLVAGLGALAIPGIGPIVAAGPITGLLSGAATGGIAGGLVDWGIPKERGKYYEGKVKEGSIVVAVQSSEEKIDNAAEVLRSNGATDVETH